MSQSEVCSSCSNHGAHFDLVIHLDANETLPATTNLRRADYLTKVVVAGKSSKDIKVSTIMTPEHVLKTVAPTDTVLAAMELMIDNNFRHVPVVRGLVSWRGSCAVINLRCMLSAAGL